MQRTMAVVAFSLIWMATGCNRVETVPGSASGGSDGPSGVLLVTIDTLRADHVGAYGAEGVETPTLDALSAGGVRFETAITTTPITLPSHASILTGTYPPRHGVRHNGSYRLDGELTTLAESFRAAGHATGAVVGAVVLRAHYGLDRGFDSYDDRTGTRLAGAAGYLERTAGEVTDAALAWLQTAGDRPFFLWVHYYDPHLEHRPPPEYLERHPGRPYDAEIAYVDAELGRLLDGLRTSGRLEETLVSVTSDHGESLGEHGELNHGMTLYDAVLRVPWIVSGPGVPAGRVVEGVVRVVDLAPTLLALAGQAPLAGVDGEDLTPLLAQGAAPSDRWAYAETLMTQLDYGWAPLHAMRSNTRLFVRAPRPELYDTLADPHQRNDLSTTSGGSAELGAHDSRIAQVLSTERSTAPVELDPDERARLQALGYALPEGEVVQTGLDPKDGLRHMHLAQRAARQLRSGNYAESERDLHALLEHAPRSARVHGMLATLYLQTGRPARALPHADRAIELNPQPAHRWSDRAEIRLAVGDRTGARSDFERAAAIDIHDLWSQVGLAWLRIQDGNLPAAGEHVQNAFQLSPQDAFLRLRVGFLWLEAGAYREARRAFEEAVRLRPDFELAQARLAIEYARVGRVSEALAHREQAGALADDPVLGSQLALAVAAGGDPESGRRFLGELSRRHPDDARVARAMKALATITARAAQAEGTP